MLKIKIYDLTLTINNNLPTYPGDPQVCLKSKVTYIDKGYNILSLNFGTHTGTHVDAPLHLIDKGSGIDKIPLEKFFGEAQVVEIAKKKNEKIKIVDLEKIKIEKDYILIIRTGWENNSYKNNYFTDFPYFSPDCADYLIYKGIKAIGADIPSVDAPNQNAEFHKKMLKETKPIFEALINLKDLVDQKCIFYGLPLNLENADGSPVRAIAIQTN